MASDWIKMRVDLHEDPAVIGIASALDVDVDLVVGKLKRVWGWADSQTRDGNAPNVTEKWVDDIARLQGFARAMCKVGWLLITKRGIQVPNFERHMGQGAKNRALTSKRVQKHRNDGPVTEALPEKRREEKSNTSNTGGPDLPEVITYGGRIMLGVEECQKFHDHYTAVGWRMGERVMQNWQAALRKWASNVRAGVYGHKNGSRPAAETSRKGAFDGLKETA